MNDIVYSSDADVLAAIPALAGFTPSRSVVVLTLVWAGNPVPSIALVQCLDLPDTAGGVALVAHTLAVNTTLTLPGADIALNLGVIVCESSSTPLPRQDLVDATTAALGGLNAGPSRWYHLPSFTAGARWSSYGRIRYDGVLPDPGTAHPAADVAGHGKQRDRNEAEQQFTPLPAEERAVIAVEIDRVARTVRQEIAAHDLPALRRRLLHIEGVHSAAMKGVLPTETEAIAQLAGALVCRDLRESVVSPISPAHAAVSQELWLHVWRHTVPRHSTDLLGMVAVFAYVQGDGATAMAALNHIRVSSPFTLGLVQCIELGLSPRVLAVLVTERAAAARANLMGANNR